MFVTGETVGLAKWIIDDTCLVITIFPHVSLAEQIFTAVGLPMERTEWIIDCCLLNDNIFIWIDCPMYKS